MKERDLTTKFATFIKENKRIYNEVYEFKMVKTSRFAFNSVKYHQIEGLTKAKLGMWHKISDTTAMNGFTSQKPFDAIWIKAREAYVVPIFYKPRLYKKAYLIPIKKFLELQSKAKSANMAELDKLLFEMFYL